MQPLRDLTDAEVVPSFNSAFELLGHIRKCEFAVGTDSKVYEYKETVTERDGRILYELVRETQASLAIEIGFEKGTSTLHLLQGIKDNGAGLVITLDPMQLSFAHGVGLRNVERSGLSSFHQFIPCRSEFALPKLLEAGLRCNFAFVDGNHLFDQTMLEAYYIDKMLQKDSLMAFHDRWMPSIRSVAAWLCSNLPYREVDRDSDDLIVLQKTADDTRHWSDFTSFIVPEE